MLETAYILAKKFSFFSFHFLFNILYLHLYLILILCLTTFAISMNKYPFDLYYSKLDHLVTLQSSADLVSNLESWFLAIKLMQTYIYQSCYDFSAFNNQISKLVNQLATFNKIKKRTKIY